MKLAVIETGGKQYLISEGETLKIEKMPGEAGEKVKLDKVLLFNDGKKTQVGTPYLEGASVEAEVVKVGRTRKVVVFKYKSKTRYRKKNTHRQWFSEVKIGKISV